MEQVHRTGNAGSCKEFFLLDNFFSFIVQKIENNVKNLQQFHLREVSRHFAHFVEDVLNVFLVDLHKVLQLVRRNGTREHLHDNTDLPDYKFIFPFKEQACYHQEKSIRVTQ